MSHPSPSRLTLVVLAAAVCAVASLPAMAASQARIVRLSDVQGTVQIDKNTGLGFENAFVNLPVTQGTQIRTRDRGRAEIEFEDGSSMRLAPNSAIEFSTLGLSDSGSRISSVKLTEGMAYVNWLGKSGDKFDLNFSRETISLDRAAHFRVDASPTVANLSVFKGDVNIDGPAGKVAVQKKKTASFDASQDDKYTLANNIPDAALDSWDKEASSYHDQYAKNNSSPYGYGVSDLNYYGSYSNVPGYGMMWQPYFTGVGWDPFMDGAWGFYPGYGYMFASAYPWGWLPYRYGSWSFVPSYGWMWAPGGWNSVLTVPRYTAVSGVHVTQLTAPAAGMTRTVAVGRAGAVATGSSPRMVVNSGSAGMGIPRGSVQNLGHLNREVSRSGSAQVQSAPQFSATSPNRGGFGGSQRTNTASPSMGRPSAPASSAPTSSRGSSPGRTSGGSTPHR
jgi:hypothetical protein